MFCMARICPSNGRSCLWIVLLCLVCLLPIRAAGTVDEYPAAAALTKVHLAQVRRESLQAGATPLGRSAHLRYRDVWQGKPRLFVWSAASYTNPDGGLAYAVVLAQTQPKGALKVLLAAGSTSLSFPELGEEDPDDRYRVVYAALDRYIADHHVAARLRP